MTRPTTDATATILDWAPEELEQVASLQKVEDDARELIRTLSGKIGNAEIAYFARTNELRKPDRAQVLAEAAVSGKPPPPEPKDPPGAPLSDLEATVRGLKAMRTKAEEQAIEAHGAVRSRIVATFRVAAERAADDYVEACERVARIHAAIGAAGQFLAGYGGGTIVGDDWNQLDLPASDVLPALKRKGRDCYFRKVIAGGSPEVCSEASSAAFAKARTQVTRLLGGRWPFERG